jgi:hypothetical protein
MIQIKSLLHHTPDAALTSRKGPGFVLRAQIRTMLHAIFGSTLYRKIATFDLFPVPLIDHECVWGASVRSLVVLRTVDGKKVQKNERNHVDGS